MRGRRRVRSEAARLIRQEERDGCHTRIVAITANAMPSDRDLCLASGMDEYLSKPIRTADLARVLEATAAHIAAGIEEQTLPDCRHSTPETPNDFIETV